MTRAPNSYGTKLEKCRGCGAVGLVERGEFPLCFGCLPNAYAIHMAEETMRRVQAAPSTGRTEEGR